MFRNQGNVVCRSQLSSNSARRRAQRRLAVEALERRQLLAGDVLVTVTPSGTMYVTGDDADNNISITSGDVPGAIVIQGMGTTINGFNKRQAFYPVDAIKAKMSLGDDRIDVKHVHGLGRVDLYGDEGDDTLRVRHSDLASAIHIFGGQGDDRISVEHSTTTDIRLNGDFVHRFTIGEAGDDDILVNHGTAQSITIYGDEIMDHSGRAGDDTIRVNGTEITGTGRAELNIYGDYVARSKVTGGNDAIRVTNTSIRLTEEVPRADSYVTIYGDYALESTLDGGNDSVSTTNMTIDASGGTDVNTAFFYIYGDYNRAASGFIPATIIGGSDTIDVVNTQVNGSGGRKSNTGYLYIDGDYNEKSGKGSEQATILGGNDTIRVAAADVTAYGSPAARTRSWIRIFGEHNLVRGTFGGATTIGGNDTIEVKDSAILGDVHDDFAVQLLINTDYAKPIHPLSGTLGGNDIVTVQNVQVSQRMRVFAGAGDDTVELRGCNADQFYAELHFGDDSMRFDDNVIGDVAELIGGPGFDRLRAAHNVGTIVDSEFEDVNIV